MTKRTTIAFVLVALLLSPVVLAVGALVVIPLLIVAIAALPLLGIAVLTGMITLAERAIAPSPGGPPASLMTGAGAPA